MKILFWVPYPTQGASNRYRIEQYIPYLERMGICYLHPFWSPSAYKILYEKGRHFKKLYYFILGSFSRLFDTLSLFHYDVIIIHREAYPIGGAFFENAVSFFKKPVIFDFDDAIFLPASSHHNNFIEKFKRPNKIASIIRKSEYVIAGNEYLADFARRYNRCVYVIPTCINTDKYLFHKKNYEDEITIGWVGSITTLGFLDSMRNVFIRLSDKYNHLKFKIIGGVFSVNGLRNIISKPWIEEDEENELKSLDIGIMPMPDNEWTKGKCGFKAILYMSMGIPCVCANVGANKEIISEGENGFLADSEDDWVKKLSSLIESPDLRQKIAVAGRKTVEEKFSLKANAPKFVGAVQAVFNGRINSI